MNVAQWNTKNFDAEAAADGVSALVDFSAQWCGPCQAMAPVFADLAASGSGSCKFGKVDIDDSPELADRFLIRSVPTIVALRGGVEQARLVGVQTKEQLAAILP